MFVECLTAEFFLREVERVVAFQSRSRRPWSWWGGGLLRRHRGRGALSALGYLELSGSRSVGWEVCTGRALLDTGIVGGVTSRSVSPAAFLCCC